MTPACIYLGSTLHQSMQIFKIFWDATNHHSSVVRTSDSYIGLRFISQPTDQLSQQGFLWLPRPSSKWWNSTSNKVMITSFHIPSSSLFKFITLSWSWRFMSSGTWCCHLARPRIILLQLLKPWWLWDYNPLIYSEQLTQRHNVKPQELKSLFIHQMAL